MTWADHRTLIVEIHTSLERLFMLIRFDYENGQVVHEKRNIRTSGWLVDPRPLVEDEVIWAFNFRGRASLHRVSLEELENHEGVRSARGRIVLPGEPLADFAGPADRWVVDREGAARAVRLIREDEDAYRKEILFRQHGETEFREIHSYDVKDDENHFIPVGITANGKDLVAIAYNGMNTRGVHVFDPTMGKFRETLFVRPDVDVTDVEIDPTSHQLFAAAYVVGGEKRYQSLAAYADRMLSGLGDEFAKEALQVVDISADRLVFVFRVADSMNPGAYYLRDVARGQTTLIAQEGSNIDSKRLSPVTRFVVDSADRTQVESFLTLPVSKRGSPAPLVVMPHGGPAGVRDLRDYDPFVQYFASWGFAVLQVNYRGSSGYGLDFRNSGKKQWARGIEDDIDAAVDYAIALPGVDGDRICIVGASYGGFSALSSVVRHRKRYACAVSWNGVSDIPLLADSSDIADSKISLDFFEEYIGDLETEREKLIEASPVYHADQIETPVLFIYGTDDRRVDPDHSHRMMLMLELYGKVFESLEVRGMAHAYTRREGIIISRAMRRYISKYLDPSRRYRRDPISESDALLEELESPRLDF